MSHTDPISDMLTRVRNAIRVVHETVDIPTSKLKIKIAEILKKEGYINSYEVVESGAPSKHLRIFLKYGPRGEKIITGLERVSSSGLRVYTSGKDAPRVFDGLGVSIISTSKGLMSDRQARKNKMGGEVLCRVW